MDIEIKYFLSKRAFLHIDQTLFGLVLWMMIRNDIYGWYIFLIFIYGSTLLSTSYKNIELLEKRFNTIRSNLLVYYLIERTALCAYEWMLYFILLDMYILNVTYSLLIGTMISGAIMLIMLYRSIDYSEKILDARGIKRWFIYPFFYSD